MNAKKTPSMATSGPGIWAGSPRIKLEPGERITHVIDHNGVPHAVEAAPERGAWFLPAALFTMLGFIVGWLAGQGVLS